MRRSELENLPHLVMRFISMMPQELISMLEGRNYKAYLGGHYRKVSHIRVNVKVVSAARGVIRVKLTGPNRREDVAFFRIGFKDAERAANGGTGAVSDLVQAAASEGMKFIEGNHRLWAMLTEE